jgi:lipoyl(octanoyl) transferase
MAIRHLGRQPFARIDDDMRGFTAARTPSTPDEIWVVQHEPVYTLGMGAKPEHILDPGTIPVERTDRGGQVTYHGPGQVVVYVLLDLKRRNLAVRTLVSRLEQAVIDCVAGFGIHAARTTGAPGVYVAGRKLAALGLRVRRGCSYHGVAVNVDLDLAPFAGINPCGYAGLEVTRLRDLGVDMDCDAFAAHFLPCLRAQVDLPVPARTNIGGATAPAPQAEVVHG